MSYSYATERPRLFTEEGQAMVLAAHAAAMKLCAVAGAFNGFVALKDISYGDTWLGLAILDRLVELGYIREVTANAWGQDRVFVARGGR